MIAAEDRPRVLSLLADLDPVLAELNVHGDRWLAAAGGRGGRGNAKFLSNRRRAPTFAEQGEYGEERWLKLELRQGRNRQVRRMTAAVGLPTLRLIRTAIGPFTVEGLRPGEWREIPRGEAEAVLGGVRRRVRVSQSAPRTRREAD